MTAKLQFKIRCKAKDLKVEIAKAYAKLPKQQLQTGGVKAPPQKIERYQMNIKDVIDINKIEDVLNYLHEIKAGKEYVKLNDVYIQLLEFARGHGYDIKEQHIQTGGVKAPPTKEKFINML